MRASLLIKSILLLFKIFTVVNLSILSVTEVRASPEDRLPAVTAFVDEMVKDYAFQRENLMSIMYQARFHEKIITTMQRPAEKKAWHTYRDIFITTNRIQGGVRFWNSHVDVLNQAYTEYGVEPEIIVAIIGVESFYGRNVGRYRVLDSLTTLTFGYPKRAKFFRNELKEFLLLNREEEKLGLLTRTGSYAGAMGLAQFMPSSYRAYAIDHNKDGIRDLWNTPTDIIGSIANYFRTHGWKKNKLVASKASGKTPPQYLIKKSSKPTLHFSILKKHGITINATVTKTQLKNYNKVSIFKLKAKTKDEYWVGFNNFYVITRYNRSKLYAMVVHQLSQQILALHNKASNEKGTNTNSTSDQTANNKSKDAKSTDVTIPK